MGASIGMLGAEKLKQKINSIFKAHGLTVKVEVNKKVVNYLNVNHRLNANSSSETMFNAAKLARALIRRCSRGGNFWRYK